MTLPDSFTWCGGKNLEEEWMDRHGETENKDLSLDTQSREELENRMIFVREEELDGVEEGLLLEGTPYSVLAPENNDPKRGKHNDDDK